MSTRLFAPSQKSSYVTFKGTTEYLTRSPPGLKHLIPDSSTPVTSKPEGISPTIWGPNTWFVLHTFAAHYIPSRENAIAFKNLVDSLTRLTPCGKCKEHLKENLIKVPLTLESLKSTEGVFQWTYNLHDLVNKQLGKPSIPYITARNFYMNPPCKSCDVAI
jgi:hypothetical protein